MRNHEKFLDVDLMSGSLSEVLPLENFATVEKKLGKIPGNFSIFAKGNKLLRRISLNSI